MYLNPVRYKVMCGMASRALSTVPGGCDFSWVCNLAASTRSSRGTRRKACRLFDISSWRKHTISGPLVKHFTSGFQRPDRLPPRAFAQTWQACSRSWFRFHAMKPPQLLSRRPGRTGGSAIHAAQQKHILFADGRLMRRRPRGFESVSQVNSGSTTSTSARGGRPRVPLSWIVP